MAQFFLRILYRVRNAKIMIQEIPMPIEGCRKRIAFLKKFSFMKVIAAHLLCSLLQRMHIASVMKQCSGYELAVIVMNPLCTLPLTSYHNNKDAYKGATL
jgi:hypothetical protein